MTNYLMRARLGAATAAIGSVARWTVVDGERRSCSACIASSPTPGSLGLNVG
jgi:hypothetical protein